MFIIRNFNFFCNKLTLSFKKKKKKECYDNLIISRFHFENVKKKKKQL